MKVSLTLEPPSVKGEAYVSHEYIRGIVTVQAQHKITVSSIDISVQGTLEVCMMRRWINPGELDWLHDKHKILRKSQSLFPGPHTHTPSTGFSLSKGNHSFPFEIRIPVLSTCINTLPVSSHPTVSLPPSYQFKARDGKGHAKIKYSLHAHVSRPGRLRRNESLRKEISLLPLDPLLPPPMFDSPVLRYRGRHVVLEASLPFPAVLFTGRRIPLRLSAGIEKPTHRTLPIVLHSLAIIIQTHTILAIGTHRNTWTTDQEILRVSKPDLMLTHEHSDSVEIDSSLWNNVLVPELLPSFTSCTVTQQYSLQMIADFRFQNDGPADILTAAINIEVHSGVSPSCTGEEIEVPWRIGSEDHLGIRRYSSSEYACELPPYS